MKQTNLLDCVGLLAVLLGVAGCSGEALIDLGGTAGSGNSAGAAGASSFAGSPPDLLFMSSTMTVQLGATKYDYSCLSAGAMHSVSWRGPAIDADSGNDTCPWPRSQPRLSLTVLFTGFFPSVGFPSGTYDLAQPITQNLRVGLNVQNRAKELAGQGPQYANYSSIGTDSYDTPPLMPVAGVSGTVTVANYGPDPENDGRADFDVSVSNVVLPSFESAGSEFPSTVTIESAHMEYRKQ